MWRGWGGEIATGIAELYLALWHPCRVQLGGSGGWGEIATGRLAAGGPGPGRLVADGSGDLGII